MITTKELRQKYFDFFRSKKHAVIPSASLIPEHDPTTLFTGSGMQPILPYLLGEAHPEGKRIVNSQKCFRAEDLEEVGDSRHTTFFEMLGNWSLGDYFKKEQIPWMFEFVTKELGLDPNRIYVTCFRGKEEIGIPKDEETANLWVEEFKKVGIDAKVVDLAEENGMQGGRIFYYDETKNWWSRVGVTDNMPVGEPGGPDSEIFWDFGTEPGLHEKSEFKDGPCHVNCDCGRFFEIGNNVFMEYVRKGAGFEKLPQKNVDFGGGLERMVTAVNDNPDIFMIDVFDAMREVLQEMSGKTYGENDEDNHAFRVIMDHMRAATFLIGDGAVPSNKDQGYFTRRFIRRSIRFADELGVKEKFCETVAGSVIDAYHDSYPGLLQKKDLIIKEMKEEEFKFRKTLKEGIKIFTHLTKDIKAGAVINAKDAFDLYQTYGFPLDMTQDLAEEKGLTVDVEGFKKEFKKHQELSRLGAEQKFKGGLADHTKMTKKYHTATHLLHAALRKILGEQVEQKGSNITEKRLRFDFSHPEKMTDEEKQKVTDLVNEAIEKDLPVRWEEMTLEEAKAKGAIGLFGDKYGEKVKVYTIGQGDDVFSREICGGPHAMHTGKMGHFKIKKEEASSRGVRRIKAVLE